MTVIKRLLSKQRRLLQRGKSYKTGPLPHKTELSNYTVIPNGTIVRDLLLRPLPRIAFFFEDGGRQLSSKRYEIAC